MAPKTTSTETSRKKNGPTGPRQQPTYPAGQRRAEPDDTETERSQKQPGQALENAPDRADDAE